jgi:DNA primase
VPAPRLPIAPILEHYGFEGVNPEEHGWFKICCAFHGESHASATYTTQDGGAFKCFACDMAGDAYSLIMRQEGVTFPEAKTMAEEITGTTGETPTDAPQPVRVSPLALLDGETPVRPARRRTRSRRRRPRLN